MDLLELIIPVFFKWNGMEFPVHGEEYAFSCEKIDLPEPISLQNPNNRAVFERYESLYRISAKTIESGRELFEFKVPIKEEAELVMRDLTEKYKLAREKYVRVMATLDSLAQLKVV